ncbi:phosphotransferase family protein [Mycolicibacterium novocastrense]|uniref:Phosphotransferase enzyme family protein n=1 Tax=Mycolicibacterium novocastrense TaxID=59813 RepID=A0AAW5SGT9_MYCNV|nr:phosphotransferase family protein [Mycolicibacterium novocastrense]MCV7022318.1 phosphotransferase family protein [Mycolicibacterium novocastrense]GAT10000.1 phosphotransferase enzyme family protein [Mycolicibacterium novocastrense]
MTYGADVGDRLTEWLAAQLPNAETVGVEGLDRVEFGHSAEMMVLTLVAGEARRDVVVRLQPRPPALLEPYDLAKQFTVLRALEGSAVRVPRVLWLEGSGDVLGRPFFVMERVTGTVYEMEEPDADHTGIQRMCESMADQLAAIHTADIDALGLATLDAGDGHLDREIDHWASEMERLKRGPLPALERLLKELKASRPQQYPKVTLVHGDAKPGNFAFAGGEVSAVFDWELTTVGDPLTDIGYLELLWRMPVGIPAHEAAPSIDEIISRYEASSGIEVRHREWYRALNAFKLAVINLVGAHLFDSGVTDDQRFRLNAYGIPLFTQMGLADLGVTDKLDDGPVMPTRSA